MNSALEILFHSHKLISNLLIIENINKKMFINKLVQIYNQMLEKENCKFILILNFITLFINKYNYFRAEQNDSIEFFRIILNETNTENNLLFQKKNFKEFKPLSKNFSEIREEYNKFFLSKEDSFIIKLFYI